MQRLALVLVSLALACASGGPGAEPEGEADGIFGYVRLVPREGVEPARGGGGSYGDRRLAGVRFVDYERPGFAVVYAEGQPGPEDATVLEIRSGVSTAHIEPSLAAVGRGGRIVLHNRTADAHVVSLPARGAVHRLEAGERLALSDLDGGEQPVFLLDAPRASARVFVAPGPYAVTSESGRFHLAGLAPGRVRLWAWHPRFPPTSRWVEVGAGAQRVDLEMGVGSAPEAP